MGHWIYYLPHRFDVFHKAEKSNRPVNWKQNTSYPFLWVITRNFWKITATHSEQRSQMLDTKSRTSALEMLHTHTNSAVLMRTLLLIQFYLHFKHRLLNSTLGCLYQASIQIQESAFCNTTHGLWAQLVSLFYETVLNWSPKWANKRLILMLALHPQHICSCCCSRLENTLVKLLTQLQHTSAYVLYTYVEHNRLHMHTHSEVREKETPTCDHGGLFV